MTEDYRMDCACRLSLRLAAGYIKRWHTIPIHGGQTVADHTYRVVQILRFLEPVPTIQLLCAALDHDVGEAATGDIPFGKKTKDAIALEKEVLARHKIQPNLTKYERDLLKAADLLEMGYFAVMQIDLGNHMMGSVLENVIDALKPLYLINDRVTQLYEELVHEHEQD
jgi:5'-deoxynucleotidase YfbR-like HD superfamily hydrolase